ncbi:hypothetical protein NEUTE1DRAFT_118869, partial [Neurospora tetrasperma FGSC 2508]
MPMPSLDHDYILTRSYWRWRSLILVQPVPCPKRYPAAAITDFLIPCGTRSRRRFDEEEEGRLKLA